MKVFGTAAFITLGAVALAQQVHYDYHRSANFRAYNTYQWVDFKPVDVGDQLLDRDIKRAVDAQLAGKGMRRVDSGGDLLVGYHAAISPEKTFDSQGWDGPFMPGPWGSWSSNTRVTSSTIEVGRLVVGLFDPATKQLVWRGSASKTLDIRKDPDKNYRALEKAMAKLFSRFPPGVPKS